MEYPLSITSLIETQRDGKDLRSRVTHVMAETDLGPFTDFGTPTFFFGKLVDVTEEQILYFRYAPGVEVLFRGGRYRFESISPTGTFKLVRTN
ncbi:hypothetical protein HDF16_005477 [Granulicella aggregans]|uniref:Uncharacterized protein n=1 Tax=Granulicella aggregans TaxID=474949 RepID=A0A7W7ZIX2_9BACT|nr:hypothetical protein [Granulicella aggregans]MBB5060741.1 hypothetical protein [Granulicella aggregans]